MRRLLNILIALDAFLFCLLCFGGTNIGETASEAAYRMETQGKFFGFFRPVIDWMARTVFDQEDHCALAFEAARQRAKEFIKNNPETT